MRSANPDGQHTVAQLQVTLKYEKNIKINNIINKKLKILRHPLFTENNLNDVLAGLPFLPVQVFLFCLIGNNENISTRKEIILRPGKGQ